MVLKTGLKSRSTNKLSGRSGYTLVEIAVSLVILSLVITAAFQMLSAGQDSHERGIQIADARQNLRTAFEMMARDVRAAGSGLSATGVSASLNNNPFHIYPVTPETNPTGFTLMTATGDSVATNLRKFMKFSKSNMRCYSVDGFNIGDLVIVTDGVTAHMFQVTDISAADRNLKVEVTSAYNPDAGHSDWPPNGYIKGGRVLKIDMIRYYVDPAQKSCMRESSVEGASYVSGGITFFDVVYHLSGSDTTRTPADPMEIRAVTLTMRAESDHLRSGDPASQVLSTTLTPRCGIR
jgi:prepilin-type N-terminal cleavage/methylation domain-containing protein